jgi:hypothetical protein
MLMEAQNMRLGYYEVAVLDLERKYAFWRE